MSRGDPDFKETKLLLLTAVTEGTDKDPEYWKQKFDVDAYMAKPFKASELMRVVEELLSKTE